MLLRRSNGVKAASRAPLALSLSVSASFAVCLALSVAACSGVPDGADETAGTEAQAVHTAERSHIGDRVIAALSASPAMARRTWNVSTDNRLDGSFLLSSPVQAPWGSDVASLSVPDSCTAGCDADFARQLCETQSDCTGGGTCTAVAASVSRPGMTARKMCVGHSDALGDEIYNVITSAERFVDVTSLQPPDGRLESAIRNALTVLSYRTSPPRVRLLFGAFPVQGVVNTKTVTERLTRDVAKTSKIQIAVGAMRSSNAPPSWNHSKIVAADGKVAIVGGHNLWSQHYLEKNPTHDLSMRVSGTAAGDAHRFANELWDYTCANVSALTYFTWSVYVNRWVGGRITTGCPARYDLTVPAGPSTGTVISVGRLGSGITKDGNQADAAQLAMIDAARSTVRMSLQDIGPVKIPYLGIPIASWPDALLKSLGSALLRGVDVYAVLSNVDSIAGGLTATEAPYANGWSPVDVARKLRDHMAARAGFPRGAALNALVCQKLHVAPFRYSGDETWPDGVPFASHAKTLLVDEQAFYIGSQNLYPAGLQEFGYIVDDSLAARAFMEGYWSKVWRHSSARAATGSEVARCEL